MPKHITSGLVYDRLGISFTGGDNIVEQRDRANIQSLAKQPCWDEGVKLWQTDALQPWSTKNTQCWDKVMMTSCALSKEDEKCKKMVKVRDREEEGEIWGLELLQMDYWYRESGDRREICQLSKEESVRGWNRWTSWMPEEEINKEDELTTTR